MTLNGGNIFFQPGFLHNKKPPDPKDTGGQTGISSYKQHATKKKKLILMLLFVSNTYMNQFTVIYGKNQEGITKMCMANLRNLRKTGLSPKR